MLPPSLHGHYSVSSVLCSNPTPYGIGFPNFIIACTILLSLSKERIGSPKLTVFYRCIACDVLRPRGANYFLHIEIVDFAFRTSKHVSPPVLLFRGSISSTLRLTAYYLTVYAYHHKLPDDGQHSLRVTC